MKFHERLRELRKFNNMTQEELSLKMGISAAAVGLYEQDRRSPDNETLIKLASIFDVSIDYLLGFEDKKTTTDTVSYNGTNPLKNEIIDLIKEKNIPEDKLALIKDIIKSYVEK